MQKPLSSNQHTTILQTVVGHTTTQQSFNSSAHQQPNDHLVEPPMGSLGTTALLTVRTQASQSSVKAPSTVKAHKRVKKTEEPAVTTSSKSLSVNLT